MPRDRLRELQLNMDDDPGSRPGSMRVSFKKPRGIQETVNQAHEDLERMQGLTEKLALTHLEIISSGSTRTDKLDHIVDDIVQSAKRVRNILHEIKGLVNSNDRSAKGRMLFAQYEAISIRFSGAMRDFRNEQINYRERCKQQIKFTVRVMNPDLQESEIEQKVEEGLEKMNRIFVEGGNALDMQESRLALNEIEARHRDIMKLEESIREMNKMFTDIAIMIESQGESISRIEDHVVAAVDYAQDGQKQLAEAQRHQTAARYKKLWIVAIVVIILALIIIIASLVR